MKYALFIGCTIQARLTQYEASARAVCEGLGIELVDIRDFNCCGYPMRNYDQQSFLLSSARNIGLAGKAGLNIMALCKCCYGSLKKAQALLDNGSMPDATTSFLKNEKLSLDAPVEIKHFLSVLYHDIGIEPLMRKITSPFKGLKIAAHYGCHALRPKDVVDLDDPENPVLFDELVRATGAQSVDWQSRLQCCGAPLLGINDEISESIMQTKLKDSKEAGADYLCSACPYCQIQFDRVQNSIASRGSAKDRLASILFSQLLGLSMGIDSARLQLNENEIDISGIEKFR